MATTAGTGSTLLIGEADFSFARALGKWNAGGDISDQAPRFIIATEFGSAQDVCDRYFAGSKKALQNRCAEVAQYGIEVVFGVDVTRLNDNSKVERWKKRDKKNNEDLVLTSQPFWTLFDGKPKCNTVVFNFPHTTKRGKTTRLLHRAFKSFRCAIVEGNFSQKCKVEMRLRHVSQSDGHDTKLIRSPYEHKQAAAAAGFSLISIEESDLEGWKKFGYKHRATKRNHSAGHLKLVKVWRWEADEFVLPPKKQPLPDGMTRRSDFFAIESIVGDRVRIDAGGYHCSNVKEYLVKWKMFDSVENTWELSKNLDYELRQVYLLGKKSIESAKGQQTADCR